VNENQGIIAMTEINEVNEQLFDEDTTISSSGVAKGQEKEEIVSDEKIMDPFDPTLIRVETKTMTIDLLLTRIKHKELELTPGFQRKGGLWSDDAQSRLIESTLIRIPLPAFYVDGTNDEKWLMVDGQQRLTALKRFVLDQEFALQGLEFLTQLEGKKYSTLSRPYQRRIVETQVTVFLIDKGTPPAVKFNIFKRINTGGLPLSPQEIRHALNQGKATELLARLADSKEFKLATASTIDSDRMEDREYILRFFAFTLFPYTEYRTKEFDSFLNDSMHVINIMSDRGITNLESQFFRAMNAFYDLLSKDAFRFHGLANKALFECWSVNLSQLGDEQLQLLKERKKLLQKEFRNLIMINSDFLESQFFVGDNSSKVKRRFSTIEQLIKDVLA
jgi:uncharacterized protein with ParB-like and HNH nuclease domain